MNEDATLGCVLEGALDLRMVEAEDYDFNTLFRLLDGFDQRRGTISGLNDQLQ